jgi:hypothetical protein
MIFSSTFINHLNHIFRSVYFLIFYRFSNLWSSTRYEMCRLLDYSLTYTNERMNVHSDVCGLICDISILSGMVCSMMNASWAIIPGA